MWAIIKHSLYYPHFLWWDNCAHQSLWNTSMICLLSKIFIDVEFHCSVWSVEDGATPFLGFWWRYLQCSFEHSSPFSVLMLNFHLLGLPSFEASHSPWLCLRPKYIWQKILFSLMIFHILSGVMFFKPRQCTWYLCGASWQKPHFPALVFACGWGGNFEIFCLSAFCVLAL